ncbi:SMI1/KNR4 family protein [Enemella sp. A6]|uniref:SMI1/KNR4 family protein n=1 Tax=Enemella sp. A6 TaxID=3440152 RepID=UPI003EB93BFB
MQLNDAVLTRIAGLVTQTLSSTDLPAARLSSTFGEYSSVRRCVGLDTEGQARPFELGDDAEDDLDDLLDELSDSVEEEAWALELTVDREGGWSAVAAADVPERVRLRPVSFSHQPVELPAITRDEEATLAELWQAGAADFETVPGAADDELAGLAETIGQPVPPQLAALLRLTNGAVLVDDADEDEEFDEEAGANSLLGGLHLMSTDEIADEYRQWRQAAEEGHHMGVAYDLGETGLTQLRLAHPGWIPFAQDYAGNHLAIDTVPGPAGTPGQVIEFGSDSDDGPFVHAASLIDYLAGRRRSWPEDLELDVMVSADESGPLEAEQVPPAIQSLRLFGHSRVEGRSVARATNLKLLLIKDAHEVDLTGLTALPLQEIRLLDLPEVDLTPLAGHPTLRLVTLERIDRIRGGETLASLPALEELCLEGATPDEVLTAAGANQHLHVVELGRFGDLPLTEKVRLIDVLRGGEPTTIITASAEKE